MQTRRVFLYFVSSSATGLIGCGDSEGDGSDSATSMGDGGDGGSDGSGDGADSGSADGPGDGDGGTGGDDGSGDDGETGGGTDETGGGVDCEDPFEGGELLGTLPFLGESGTVGSKTGAGTGHDARLNLDLTTVDENNLITPNDLFYIRTEYPDQINESDPWTIRIHGLVSSELVLPLEDLLAMTHRKQVVCLECSGNSGGSRFGLMSAAEFGGVPLMDVLDLVDIDASATMVLVSGFDQHSSVSTHSTPGASWTFTFDQIAEAGGMLVTEMNGQPLPRDHGQPVRLLMPGWYGCCNAKWVDEIRLVDDSEPSTAQMREYASRTHQSGTPQLAADYQPGTMDQSAMLTRVEKWLVNGEIVYKLMGIMWGGYEATDKLVMEIEGIGTGPIEVCPPQTQNSTWTLWSQAWSPPQTGQYAFSMQVDDPGIVTKRLDSGYYTRVINVDEI